ncbi:serine/threonine protein kinase with TPR repeats [Candidatus Koribacter versatilis Ellin345]|uniref:Serine/threonine protein kinase with TPR repeats n=1 Tax=Koribacter versatilis (strain Ellin345) TaxID=204669 RepID=Q1IJ63_KORVE|nr:serine/threonine-protein kinase [Candidatus Koribacter versatilis]ABF43087.1 serine/threonine protein kinase with TPR repeats [Candidatus Koribacter versatilis Ellin345]
MSFGDPEDDKRDIGSDDSLLPTAGQAELSAPETADHALVSIPNSTAEHLPGRTPGRLESGDRLANRFRIVRFIAKGGMGEVYEAEDEVVRVRLALKTILPAIAANPDMVEQLKLEMRSARRVTHPNVCRLIEVFEDRDRQPAVMFLTMELVEGESLSDVIHRSGPLPLPQFYRIAAQIAAGLDAVHRAEIVHQDFKTSNVLLVGSGESTRAVVTDFGLAVNLQATGRDRGVAGGTPAYMAPEQVDGKTEITPAADIYAFGVVLYELLTARFPIAATTRREALDRKLTERPVSPSHYRPDIPKYTERAILKCLERNPQDRFASVMDALAAVEGRAEKRRKKLAAFATTVAVLLAVASFGGYAARRWFLSHRTPTVAVLSLHDASARTESTSTGTELTELLTSNLGLSKGLTTVPAEDVSLAQGEFPVTASASFEQEDLSAFRRAIGADYLVIGKYTNASDGKLAFDLKLERPDGGTLDSIHEEGTEQNAGALIADAASKIRQRLGTQLLSDSETEEAENIYPRTDEGRKLYFQALAQLRALNSVEAASLSKKAANAEPDNPSIHATYAEALNLLKNMPAAQQEAKRAAELAQGGKLPPEFVTLLEARSAELNNDWKTAIQKLDALFTFTRDNLQYGLMLSNAQTLGAQPSDALKTIARLSKLKAPAGTDPRIQIAAAETYAAMGNYTAEIQSAERAVRDAQARSWRMMQAKASLQLCWAYQRNGDSAKALASCDTARTVFADFGDGVSGAVALNRIANELVTRGQYQEAKNAYDRVLAIVTKAQSQHDMAGAHLNLALTLLNLGDQKAAQQHAGQAIEIAAHSGDRYDEARARLISADLLRASDDLPAAIQQARLAQQVAHDAQDRDAEGYALNNLALYLQESGDSEAAFNAAHQALDIRKQLGVPTSISVTQALLGDLYLERGDLPHARSSYAAALQLQEPTAKAQIAQLQLAAAQADFQSDEFDAALKNAQTAVAEFQREKDSEETIEANTLILRILTRKKDLAAARPYYEQLAQQPSQDHDIALAAAVARAEFLIASAQPVDAAALLRPLLGLSEKPNYLNLEARLVLARAQQFSSKPQSVTDLRDIASQAEKLGFHHLAAEARQSLH